MEENTNVFLGTERVGKLMRGYAVPCIISLLVGALYNIVDQIFIANADYLGSYGNAANTVVFPLTVAALAIAVMVGDGCCAYVSINLGKKDVKTAKKSVGNAVVLVLLASAALTAVYLLLAEPILTMFGGRVNVETFRYAKEYFFYIALGVPFYMFGQALILVEFFPQQLISLFGAANESAFYTEFAVKAFRVYLYMMIPACVNKACFIFLQALGKALSSTVLSMLREVVFGVGFAILLPIWFGLDGVLYSMPVSDILTFVVSVVLILGTYRELNSKAQ